MNREVLASVFILFIGVTAHETYLDCFDPQGKINCVQHWECPEYQIEGRTCPKNQICCANLIRQRWPPNFGKYTSYFKHQVSKFFVRNIIPDRHFPPRKNYVTNVHRPKEPKPKFYVYNVEEKKETPDIIFIDSDYGNHFQNKIQHRNIESRDIKSKPGDKSKLYCKKYTKYAMNTSYVMPLLPEYMASKLEKESCPPKFQPLIVGGMNATIKDFPHMAALGYRINDEMDYLCGGTIISENFVLTAAHCSKTRWGPPVVVNVGATELFDPDGIEVSIEDIILHPEYQPPSIYNDIALVKLSKKLKFNNGLRPACLATDESKAQSPGKVAVATGWGKIGFGRESSNYLLKVRLKVISNVECNKYYASDIKIQSLKHGITSNMICALGCEDITHDTCQGDSGGPLQAHLPDHKCMIEVIGITSFGKACGTGFPGVYTKVAPYLSWIESIIWP